MLYGLTAVLYGVHCMNQSLWLTPYYYSELWKKYIFDEILYITNDIVILYSIAILIYEILLLEHYKTNQNIEL